ncbi:MAG: GldG family protein [Acutalibacter sp.]|jgi:ABC-2 type transport system permease protein|nr:GldG family protein [Acutalibacter sp.]
MDENKQNQEPQKDLEPVEEASVSQAEPQPESKPEPKSQQTPERKPSVFQGNKFKRGGMATVMTVVFIAVVVVLNLLVSLLSERFPSMNIDLTAQKMNTLSEQALEVAGKVEEDTTIYLIGAEEAYRKDQLYSNYGLKYSQVANLADRLAEANSKVKVEFVDPDTNPEFISSYAGEVLTSGRVLVRTEKRYRVLTVDDMFSMSQNQQTGATEMYSNVDSALAAALEMVNMDKVPILTIATGHDELLNTSNMAAFLKKMEEQNFEHQEINLLTDEIPEGTQLLMIPTPTTDYTDDELEKLRALLSDQSREESIAILVTFHPTQTSLPKLSGFLEEWGISVQSGAMVTESDSSRYISADPSYVMVDAVGKALEDNTYSRILCPMSAPVELLFSGNGDIATEALLATGEGAYIMTEDTSEADIENPDTAQRTTAARASSLAQFEGNQFYYRSLVVFGSSYMFTDTFLETAFDNSQYIIDLMKFATDTDGSRVSVYTDKVQTNVVDVTASQNTITVLGLGVFTIGLPVLILAAGLVIFLKRRHL